MKSLVATTDTRCPVDSKTDQIFDRLSLDELQHAKSTDGEAYDSISDLYCPLRINSRVLFIFLLLLISLEDCPAGIESDSIL